MINVTVIGFGYVGSSLSLILLNSKHPIRLNVMEPSAECAGAFLDLAHAMPLFQQKELHVNDENLFLNADYIFYAAGIPNQPGVSRLTTAADNVQLSREIFAHRTFDRSPYIFVITNPVDVISHAVYAYSGVPQERVWGIGTFLDSVRLTHYLSAHTGLDTSRFKSLVLGEHGDSQVCCFSQCTADGKPLIDGGLLSDEDLRKLAIQTRDAATEIRKTQDGTTYGVATCAAILLEYLLDGATHKLTLSARTNAHYRNILGLEEDIYIGLPVRLEKGHIKVDNTIELNKEELTALTTSAKLLSDIEQSIKAGI